MTSPKLAIATDQGRFYTDPRTGELYPSVTNIIDRCVNKPVLVPWAAKITAEHILKDKLSYYAKLAMTDLERALKESKSQVRFARESAMDLGTRVHDYAENLVLGAPTVDDPEVAPYAVQLARWFDAEKVDFGVDVEAAECTVMSRIHGYAGTGDLWWWQTDPDGSRHLVLVDYKSSATRPVSSVYPEYSLQLAALGHAEVMVLKDDTEVEAPTIARHYVLNLRPNSYRLVPIVVASETVEAFLAGIVLAKWMIGRRGSK